MISSINTEWIHGHWVLISWTMMWTRGFSQTNILNYPDISRKVSQIIRCNMYSWLQEHVAVWSDNDECASSLTWFTDWRWTGCCPDSSGACSPMMSWSTSPHLCWCHHRRRRRADCWAGGRRCSYAWMKQKYINLRTRRVSVCYLNTFCCCRVPHLGPQSLELALELIVGLLLLFQVSLQLLLAVLQAIDLLLSFVHLPLQGL